MADLPTPLQDALREIAGHPAVRGQVMQQTFDDGRVLAHFDVEVELPSRAKDGVSITGVRRLEPVALMFPTEFPLKAPSPRLRTDFPSNLPHINPHRAGDPVPPCIFEGDLTELMHRMGLEKVLDQLMDWLRRAAAGQLMNLQQGWEPTRRGDPDTSIEFDADVLVKQLPRDGAILQLPGDFFHVSNSTHIVLRAGELGPEFQQAPLARDPSVLVGRVRVLMAAAPWETGQPRILDEFAADTVLDVPGLLQRAVQLGIAPQPLEEALESIFWRASFAAQGGAAAWPWPGDFFVAVVLAAHRPVALIGSHRTVEFIPYVVRVRRQSLRPELRDAQVGPAFHLHVLSPELLAAASGHPRANLTQAFTIVGCGSLGSKVSLHLGRAGFGRQHLVDSEVMSPHNVARHGLLERGPFSKAQLTRDALLKGMAHAQASALAADAAPLLMAADRSVFEQLVPQQSRLLLDTTASHRVVAAMCASQHLDRPDLRVARAFLIGGGRVAALLLEGPARAVRLDDLLAQLYEACRADPGLRGALGGDGRDLTQLFVGDNCRSLTLAMPDSVLSRGAALVTTQLQRWLVEGFPDEGTIAVGTEGGDRVGMDWRSWTAGPSVVLAAAGDGGWTVRVSASVAGALNAESRTWAPLETGGALLGHVDPLFRTICVVGMVAAPPDSERSREKFVLGTRGLQEALRQGFADSVGYLHYVGTWHSHPQGGPHSPLDRDTLGRLAGLAPGVPMVSLVWTPQGLLCEVERFRPRPDEKAESKEQR